MKDVQKKGADAHRPFHFLVSTISLIPRPGGIVGCRKRGPIVNGAAVSGAGLGAGVTVPCAVRRATFPALRFLSGWAGLCPAGRSTMRRRRGAA